MQLFTKDSSQRTEQLFNSIKIYIERIEKPMNFIDHDAWVETKRRIMVEQDILQQTDIARKRAIMEEGVEQQLKKQKENHIKQNQQAIREEQKEHPKITKKVKKPLKKGEEVAPFLIFNFIRYFIGLFISTPGDVSAATHAKVAAECSPCGDRSSLSGDAGGSPQRT